MFGTNYGIIQNLKLENVMINAPNADYVGGIAGINAGKMENCTVSGTVSGTNNVGGMVGLNDDGGFLSGCTVLGAVSGRASSVGGVVGYNFSTLTDCTAFGMVSYSIDNRRNPCPRGQQLGGCVELGRQGEQRYGEDILRDG